MPRINLRGECVSRLATIETSAAHALSDDAEALLRLVEASDTDDVTQDDLDEFGRALGFTAGQQEAAILSAIWAGRLKRD
jgi:hypothetical protein